MLLTKLFGKAKNYSSDIAKADTQKKRLKACSKCPKYRKDFKYLLIFKKRDVPQCGVCKCAINDKIIWDDEKCPNSLW